MTVEPATAGLYRLLSWFSPGFPTGGFSYSHGLEAAVADDAVRDRATLERWIAAVVTLGGGRIDADLVRDAYRAAADDAAPALAGVNRRGLAYRGTAELALEASQQGAAFRAAYEAAWTGPRSRDPGGSPASGEGVCHPVIVGLAAARAGLGLRDALVGYLHAFAANLVSAGLRLGVIGQTDGQRILAALEPVVAAAAQASLSRAAGDFGSAAVALEIGSMRHETQYTRLFRS